MTLHPVYGFPYLPGSALKGVTRSYIVNELFDRDEERALQDEGFCRIFDSPKESSAGSLQGAVRFIDAFPVAAPVVEPDLMNPHYIDYYSDNSKKKPPGDYYDPKPIYFLTVRDTKFAFYLGIREKHNTAMAGGQFVGETPLQVAREWLKKALTWHGIGAKAAVGYGYFLG